MARILLEACCGSADDVAETYYEISDRAYFAAVRETLDGLC